MSKHNKETAKYSTKVNLQQHIKNVTYDTKEHLSPILQFEFTSEEDKHNFLEKIVLEDIKGIKKIKNLSEQDKIFMVTIHPDAIQYIENPSENVQIRALKSSPKAYKYINNPSERVQLVALIELGDCAKYQEKSRITSDYYDEHYTGPKYKFTKEVQIIAAKKNPYVILCIENPCKETLIIAVKNNREIIEYIDQPDKEMQTTAIEQHRLAIFSIKNPCKEAIHLHNTLRQKDQKCKFNEKTIEIPNNDKDTYNLLSNMDINDKLIFKNKYYIPALIQSLIDQSTTISPNRNNILLNLLGFNEHYYRFTDGKKNFWFLSRNNNNLSFAEVCLEKIEESEIPNFK